MIDEVLNDVKNDYDFLVKSYETPEGAISNIKKLLTSYVMTRRLSYAEGVRVASSMIFVLVDFKKRKQNG